MYSCCCTPCFMRSFSALETIYLHVSEFAYPFFTSFHKSIPSYSTFKWDPKWTPTGQPVWNLKPIWKVVPFTRQFCCDNFPNHNEIQLLTRKWWPLINAKLIDAKRMLQHQLWFQSFKILSPIHCWQAHIVFNFYLKRYVQFLFLCIPQKQKLGASRVCITFPRMTKKILTGDIIHWLKLITKILNFLQISIVRKTTTQLF